MDNPKVSIIVPVYNTEKYLSRCLDSILRQTYTNWELILVDDGSRDGSGVICDKYAQEDNRIKVIHKQNGGVCAARNDAIRIANGELLSFIDSDDYIDSSMFKDMVSLLIAEQLDMVWCDVMVVMPDLERPSCMEIPKDYHTAIHWLLDGRLSGWLCNKIIRKQFFDLCKVKIDEHCVVMEDVYISIQLLNNKPRMGFINKPYYYYYRCNDTAATFGSSHKIIIKGYQNIQHIYAYLKEQNILKEYLDDFCILAMKLKIAFLKDKKIRFAKSIFPFAHSKRSNFKMNGFVSWVYWIGFNGGLLGEVLFRTYLYCKEGLFNTFK